MNTLIDQIEDKIYRSLEFQYPEFTDFLDLQQLSIFRKTFKHPHQNLLIIESSFFADDERRMIGFFPKSFLDHINADIMTLFPIVALEIQNQDLSVIEFNHRDLLGAILGQGIDRRLFGDMIFNDSSAYVLCHERIAEMMLNEVRLIGHHNVSCSIVEQLESLKNLAPKTKELSTTVSSLRLDNVMKAMLNISRTECQQLIIKACVRVNQEEITKRHFIINEHDILSIRGKGKYKVHTIGNTSKKGRIWITILQYI